MKGKKLRAIGYTRVSKREQAEKGISLAMQQQRIKAFAKAKNWDLAEIIEDPGNSGKDLNRPGIQRLLDLCAAQDINAVIVYKIDRLARSVKDLSHILEDILNPRGIGFVSITETFDTTTAMGKAMFTMIGVMAELERGLISERTTAALEYKKKNGEKLGGRRPYGFRLEGKRLAPDPDQLHNIRRMKRLYRDGKTYRKIAARFDINHSTAHQLINTDIRVMKSRYLN